MKTKQKRSVQIFLMLMFFSTALFVSPAMWVSAADPGTLKVYVVNYPLKYLAQRIGGTNVTLFFPAPPDEDPAYWTPDVRTISDYQKADLILLNGAGYAKWVSKVSLPRSKTIDTSKRFKNRYIHTEAVTHSHGSEGKHAHEDLAFTTWLDFDLAVMQAEAVLKAFTRKRPGKKDTLQQNYEKLKDDLIALDKSIERIVSKEQTKPLIVSHPVYDYFARRYQLNIKSVHWEPDETPNKSQWVELKSILTNHKSKWMIWEGNPNQNTVKQLKLLGVDSLVFDPCGNVPEQGDFLSVMKQNVNNLEAVFDSKHN